MKKPKPKSSGKNLPSKSEPTLDSPETKFDDILSKLPPGTSPEVIEEISQSISYSGPLPPPAMLEQYNNIAPGAANRIIAMAETEQNIRKRDNGWMLFNDGIRVWGSTIVSLSLIGAGVFCAYIEQPWLGGVFVASGAVPTIMKFMLKNT